MSITTTFSNSGDPSQKRQYGLKTKVSWDYSFKTGGDVGPKNQTDGGTQHRI